MASQIYLLLREGLQAVYPVVPHTVTKLLLLAVEDMLWRGTLQKALVSSEHRVCKPRISETFEGLVFCSTFGR